MIWVGNLQWSVGKSQLPALAPPTFLSDDVTVFNLCTNSRAYGTVLCPSVCLSSVCNVCIVAKRYVLPKKNVWRSL